MVFKNDYSIGVVTYVNRYHTYFKKNILSLLKYFPDKQIIVVINGHPDKLKQFSYLKKITQWLASLKIQYITFEDHQALSKCWNLILLMSQVEKILLLNDDILIKNNFRKDFENKLKEEKPFFTINSSFSHFLISKDVIRKIGWFDERFLGIGQEDGDYLYRIILGNIDKEDYVCSDIINFIAPATDSSFQNISKMIGKYASVNEIFMKKKWTIDNYSTETNNQNKKFLWFDYNCKIKINDNMETPNFYDLSLLDNYEYFAPKNKKLKDSYMGVYKHIRNFFKKNKGFYYFYQFLKAFNNRKNK